MGCDYRPVIFINIAETSSEKNSPNLAFMGLKSMSDSGKYYKVQCSRVRKVANNSGENWGYPFT